MGLFDLFKKPVPVGQNPLLTNDDYCLSRLRHAIWGDWFHSYEIRTLPRPNGIFKNRDKSRILCRADLTKCDCNDQREEDGSRIVPCHHIYRVALECGYFQQLINDPKIEGIIRNMRDPLFRAFMDGIIAHGYYSLPQKWAGSMKTFNELLELGILQGTKEEYVLSQFFRDKAAAFVYYAMTDPRNYSGRELLEGEYNPAAQCLRYEKK